MGEFLGVLIVLGIVLAVITLIGHGVWLFLAWLIRTLAGQTPDVPRGAVRPCPRCGSALPAGSAGCAVCGWPLELSRQIQQSSILRSLERDLQRYRGAELIDGELATRLAATLSAELERLKPRPAQAIGGEAIAAELVTAEAVCEPVDSLPPIPLADAGPALPLEPLDPATRARQFIERQAALAQMSVEAPPAVVAKPSRPWSEIFKAFLEEQNIRWGELVGGLLIVCCSIALVISFWSAIAERPFLKFFVFNGVTAGLFGVGIYAHRRLKLPHTSQGLLIIAALLTPLNFLAIAAFTQGPASTNPVFIGGELISIGLFTALIYLAGRLISTPWPWALVLGVMGTSISQLLVRRFVEPGVETATLYLLGALPLGCFAAAIAWALARWPRDDEGQTAPALFRLLGLNLFALVLPAGLLLVKSGAPLETLRLLAPLVSLAGAPLLAVGLVLMRRLDARSLANLRTAATAIAVLGALIWLAGIPLAWPNPASLLAICVTGGLLFTSIAILARLAPAHLLAAASLGLAVMLAANLFSGSLAWQEHNAAHVGHLLTSAQSGMALLPFCIVLAAAAIVLKTRRAEDTLYLAIAALGLSAISLALVAWRAVQDGSAAGLASPLFGIAALWLALSLLMRWPALFTACQALLSVAAVVAATAQLETRAWFQQAARPWLDPWTIQAQCLALAALALVWAGLRIVCQRAPGKWNSSLRLLLNPPWPAVDRAMNLVLLVALAALCIYGALPGIAQELTPRKLAIELRGVADPANPARIVPPVAAFELPDMPHEHALGFGTWLLGGMLIAVLLAGQWERYSPWRMLGIVAIAAAACPLLSAAWTPEVAAASALRWVAAAFLLLGSCAVWFRDPLVHVADRLHWPGWNDRPAGASTDCRTLLLALVVFFLAAMGIYVGLAAVLPNPIDANTAATLPWLALVFVVLGAASLALRGLPHELLGEGRVREAWQSWSGQVAMMLLVLGAAPLVAVSLFVVTMALRGNPITGPDAASLFARMGLAVSYAVPILLIALSLVGHALRERSERFAFAAGLLFNTAATAGYLLNLRGAQLDAALWIRLAQLNAVVSAIYALAWLATLRWSNRSASSLPALLATQVLLPIALVLVILVPAGVTLWWSASPSAAHEAAGAWLGWLSFVLALAAAAWASPPIARSSRDAVAWSALAAVATLASMSVARLDTGNWLAFHALLVGHVAAGGLVLAISLIGTPWAAATLPQRRMVGLACSLAGLIGGAIALRGALNDPQRPWWSIAALAAIALVLAVAAGWAGRQRLLYMAGLALNLAMSIWWVERMWTTTAASRFIAGMMELAQANALMLALPVVSWIIIELRVIRPSLTEGAPPRRLPMHAFAAFVSMLLIGGMAGMGLLGDLDGEHFATREWIGWLAVAASAVALAACLWDVSLRLPALGLYLLGLAAVGMTVDHFNLQPPRWLGWTGAMIAGAYALGTSYLWSRRDGLRRLAAAVGIPPREASTGPGWLVPANGLLIAAVLAAAYWVDLTFPEQGLRLLTAKAALFQTLSMGLLARGARRSLLQTAALMVGVIAAIAWGWAWLDPATTGSLLNRAVVVTAALAVMITLYGLGLAKILPEASEWTSAARRLVPALIALAGLSLLFVLGTEFVLWLNFRSVPISPLAIFVVAAALVGLAAAAIAAAVLPGRDPLGLSERGRTLYVYGAEALLALLVMHVRLTMPWLFGGFFTRYWTFLIVFLAFLGVGLSEFFARRRHAVLSEPLERTGAFLPLLPVLGFWVAPAGHYSLLLFSVGAVYATLAVMRKSFGFGVLAALAANGGLWFFLYRFDGFGLLEHPQVWCIPPAVSVLVAAWLNRDRLSAEQMTSIRYLTSMTIYVSSTADIFLNGVAKAPWLPLVLGGISLVGIFAGIFLRVRAFLFLGTSFLMLSLLTIIWHAAHNLEQTWVWAASGIVTGILIITLFALFEKKRQEVLHLVDQLKEWE